MPKSTIGTWPRPSIVWMRELARDRFNRPLPATSVPAWPRMQLQECDCARHGLSHRIGTNQKEIAMSRLLRVTLVSLALTGLALAQVPPPAAANAPGTAQGPRRPGLTPVVIGPPAPVPPEVAILRPTPAEL